MSVITIRLHIDVKYEFKKNKNKEWANESEICCGSPRPPVPTRIDGGPIRDFDFFFFFGVKNKKAPPFLPPKDWTFLFPADETEKTMGFLFARFFFFPSNSLRTTTSPTDDFWRV